VTITAAEPSAIDYVRARAAEILALDRWPRERLLELQRSRLRSVLQHAVDHSPYYRETLGADAADRELSELLALSKQVVTERFDELVTDPRVRLASVRRFLETAEPGAPLLGEFRAFATSGATGSPGVSVYSRAEFTEWVAAGLARLARVGIGPDTRLIAIGAPGDVHITRQLFAAFQSGSDGVPRLSVTTPLREAVAALNRYRPDAVIGYASVLGTLADEQLEGRLAIEPRLTIATSEVLTDETARRVEAAWGSQPFNVYAATEAPGIASGSPERVGMHVWEESVVVEVVDAGGRPVPPGVPGAKVLLTSLVSRVQPLIRYELSDSVVVAAGPDPSGRPFLRLARVDGRSDDILVFPAAEGGTVEVHPHRLRAPFSTLVEIRQYQIVHARDGVLRVRIVPRTSAAVDAPERVRAAVRLELERAGAAEPRVDVEVVDGIEREQGHAAKVKLVVSEVPRPT
jgi:phenylacetate-coenzyme A ligase PaaK-like adenylate-forming protein